MGNIVVIGSASIDLMVKTSVLPNTGETVMGDTFFTNPGGKGANQAIAAARLSDKVYMIGAVGEDAHGQQIIDNLKQNNVDTYFMDTIKNENSGTAHITLYENDNRIIVVPGANNYVTPENVLPKIKQFQAGDIIIMQQEIPEDTITAVVNYASNHGMKVILNPAPYRPLNPEIISKVDWLTPNESESQLLFNHKETQALAQLPNKLIITQGALGASFYNDSQYHIDGYRRDVIDTTGAGDTFNGALAVALNENKALADAIDFANLAASFSITDYGAQGAMPYRKDLD